MAAVMGVQVHFFWLKSALLCPCSKIDFLFVRVSYVLYCSVGYLLFRDELAKILLRTSRLRLRDCKDKLLRVGSSTTPEMY